MDEKMAVIMEFLAALPPDERLETVQSAFEDQKRLNALQALNDKADYTGTCILRLSTTGRGWRLHESDRSRSQSSVRDAIDQFFAEMDPEGEIFS